MFLAHLPTGLVGFLAAGMLAALMSTHSSYLLAWSGVLTEDLAAPIVKSLTGWEIPQSWRIWITRLFILLIGAFLLYWGLWFRVPATVWGYLAVTGTVYVAGAMTLVAFGLYWKRANRTGAYLGLLAGALPGVVYLIANIRAQTMGFGEGDSEHLVVRVKEVMTDPVTGVISFPLALMGMVAGSLWGEGRRGVRSVATAEGAGLPRGMALPGGGS